ncbi:unnamed protein product [Meganyctiphanes norvegica]|uniref:Uncharacterized protein n=1 Tax=Meganyctiphanes norvegica TaxID=48144 RepID=A0AAV2RLN4_MEGNR
MVECCSANTIFKWLAGLFLTIMGVLEVLAICLGALDYHDCPAQPMIPIFLVFGGLLVVPDLLIFGLLVYKTKDMESYGTFIENNKRWIQLFTILSSIIFIWFILNLILLSITHYYADTEEVGPHYCKNIFFTFSWIYLPVLFSFVISPFTLCSFMFFRRLCPCCSGNTGYQSI